MKIEPSGFQKNLVVWKFVVSAVGPAMVSAGFQKNLVVWK